MKLFSEDEIETEYILPKDELPMVIDCLKFVISRTHRSSGAIKKTHNSVVSELVSLLHSMWMAADCCPMSERSIIDHFEKNVWAPYRKLSKSGQPGRKHRAKPKSIPEATRKSSRTSTVDLTPETHDAHVTNTDSIEAQPAAKKQKRVATRTDDIERKEFRKKWEEEVGNHMYDINCKKVVKARVEAGYCFDYEFYEDQKTRRLQVMCVKKVTKQFLEEEKQRNIRKSRQYLRRLSAFGISVNDPGSGSASVDKNEALEEAAATDISVESDEFIPVNSNKLVSSTNIHSCVLTRNAKQAQKEGISKQMISVATQHGSVPKIPTKIGQAYNPKYLEAIGVMMSDGLSAPQAIKATYTLDTIVHEQERYLPLSMDPEYQAAYSKLKRMQKQGASDARIEDDVIVEVDSDEELESEENMRIPVIQKLKRLVDERKSRAKENSSNALPDIHTARRNHQLMSVYVEGKIALEMLESHGSGTFIMPDGTTRNKTGEIAAMLIKVNDKMRAVKAQQIGKGDRKTWADTIVHMLSRLAISSRTDVKALWSSIRSILSDLCDVNKKLGAEIEGVIGSDWEPGQLFCVLQYVLHIPTAIKTVFSKYSGTYL